ncbi:MAG: sporulation protein YqfD [Clostridia bacterium]|nr:sporulation protein YqfD [Clostridia bacterium]
MQLKDWQVYWQGYVTIVVEGKAPEKFINLALVQGIPLWDIVPLGKERFMVKVAVSQVKLLRIVARKTNTRFRIKEKKGLPFAWRRLRRRKTFVAGVLLFVCLLYWLSSLIWFVDCAAPEELQELDPREVIELAGELGLRPGVMKGSLRLREIERRLEVEIPRLAWAGIELQGTRAIIRVVEKKLPDEEQLDTKPGHLVAAKEGVIHELLSISGEPLVRVGDTVAAGQVLISGMVTPEPGEDVSLRQPRLVRARGVAKARVWYEGRGEVPLIEKGETYTGREVTVTKLVLLDREIVLHGPKTPPFVHYHYKETGHKLVPWRNWQVPVELITTTYRQVEPFRRELSFEEAKAVALKEALEKVRAQIPAGSQVVLQQEQEEEAPEGKVRVKVVIEAIEDIGKFQPLT